MNRFLFAVLLLSSFYPARAQRLVTQTAALASGQGVFLNLRFARLIRVRPGPRLAVQARVSINGDELNNAFALRLESAPGEVSVIEKLDEAALRAAPYAGPCPEGESMFGNWNGRDGAGRGACVALSYEVTLPAGTALRISTITGQLDIRLCVNMNPSSQALVLGDIARSLEEQGIDKLVILNSHGGNDFRQMIRELQTTCGVFIATINWWNCIDPKPFYDEPGDHAGELETSVMLEIVPNLVLPLSEAGEGLERKFRIDGLREGIAWAPRMWSQVTDDTGVGNPGKATREKGKRHLDAVTDRIAAFLVDIQNADLDDMYE